MGKTLAIYRAFLHIPGARGEPLSVTANVRPATVPEDADWIADQLCELLPLVPRDTRVLTLVGHLRPGGGGKTYERDTCCVPTRETIKKTVHRLVLEQTEEWLKPARRRRTLSRVPPVSAAPRIARTAGALVRISDMLEGPDGERIFENIHGLVPMMKQIRTFNTFLGLDSGFVEAIEAFGYAIDPSDAPEDDDDLDDPSPPATQATAHESAERSEVPASSPGADPANLFAGLPDLGAFGGLVEQATSHPDFPGFLQGLLGSLPRAPAPPPRPQKPTPQEQAGASEGANTT